MTNVRLHGVLAKEYGQNFYLSVGRPKNVLHAIDANRDGFIARIIQLQKEGCAYDIIVNRKRLKDRKELHGHDAAETIDLVPVIAGSGPISWGVATILGGGWWAVLIGNVVAAVVWAAVAYALSPEPEAGDQVEGEVGAAAQSYVFGSIDNVANQGVPLPLGYGRLRVGSQVIQASVKSFPQHHRIELALKTPDRRTVAICTTTVGQP